MILHATHTEQTIFKQFFLPLKNDLSIRYGIATPSQKPFKSILLLLHGRSEFLEKYEGVADQLQKNGFLIISPDWRGQGLSSRELNNRQKGYIHRFEDYISDLEALWANVIAPYGLPVYLLAHSMGGHIAIRFMGRHPLRIKKAVLASPMIDISLPMGIKSIIKVTAKRLSRTSFAKKYAIGAKDYSLNEAVFRGNRLSHDPEKFSIQHNEIAKNPDLALGGVTWAWLNAAFDSIDRLTRDAMINRITTPVLLLNAKKDTLVSTTAQKRLIRKLKNGSFRSIQGAFHELFFETATIRSQVWEAFHGFIDT